MVRPIIAPATEEVSLIGLKFIPAHYARQTLSVADPLGIVCHLNLTYKPVLFIMQRNDGALRTARPNRFTLSKCWSA
jgi:hypothetical protein